MERFNVIKDIAIQLGLTQVENSWIKTLGAYLGVTEVPGGDDYEQRVFTAAVSNSAPGIGTNIGNSDLIINTLGTRNLTLAGINTTDIFQVQHNTNTRGVLKVFGDERVEVSDSGTLATTTKFNVRTSLFQTGIRITQTFSSAATKYGMLISNSGGGGGDVVGAIITTSATTGTFSYGIQANALGTGITNIGVNINALNGTGANIALLANVTGSQPGAYFAQFRDSTTNGTGKMMASVTADGRAQWQKVTSTYTTGASGTFTSVDGKTITVTNGLITSIV